jgi:hypothetical protein
MSIVDDAFKTAAAGLDFKRYIDRLRGAYVRRRAELLHHGNVGWSAAKIASQITAELAVVSDYIKRKEPLIQGTETTTPAHLDLREARKVKEGVVDGEPWVYLGNRKVWVVQIVWRAVAIHPNLWQNSGSPPNLRKEALDDILDRRLRAVEQLHCNVNSGGYQVSASGRQWAVQGPQGPWSDGFLVRNFEYPFLPKAPFKDVLPSMTGWRDVGSMVLFSGVRVPQRIRGAWKLQVSRGGTAWVVYQSSQPLKHSDVFRMMFAPPRKDFFDRNWLYCDMVGSAVNIEALEFAIQRRPGDHTDFDTVMNQPGYVNLGPVVQFDGPHDLDILMCDDKDPFFENVDIDLDDLQVGDFVCFWNSRVYDLLAHGAWGNEFSHVMHVDINGESGKALSGTDGPQILLAGHGISLTSYSAMAAELIRSVKGYLDSLRISISNTQADSATTPLGGKLIRWAPYEPFIPPGAWWLEIPKAIWHDKWAYATVDDVLKSVPRTVALEAGGTGYQAPPDKEAVYFPLFEPAVTQTDADGDSWRAYLRKRREDANFRVFHQLKELAVDGRLAPGLYYRGSQAKIPVVRPRVRI